MEYLNCGHPSLPNACFSLPYGILQANSSNDHLLNQLNGALHSRTLIDNTSNDFHGLKTPEVFTSFLINVSC